jgi:hypothetical protein
MPPAAGEGGRASGGQDLVDSRAASDCATTTTYSPPVEEAERTSNAESPARPTGSNGVGEDADDDLLPALFWDGTEDWINEDNCADFAALQSLKYDDTTPEERADEYKRKGNDALKYKQNKVYVRKAVQQYTLALMEKVDDPSLNSVLHSNRAHAALLLGNSRKALEDAQMSVELNPANVKGWFRAAKSASGIEKLDECIGFCLEGLKLEDGNRDLQTLLKAAKKGVAKRAEQAQRDDASRVEVRSYMTEIVKRQLKYGPPIMGTGERMPEFAEDDGDALTHWVLFVYPESMQTDVMERFDERSTFSDQLDDMFSDDAPPLDWDSAGAYTRDRLELYYQSNAVRAYPLDVLEGRLLDNARGSRRSEPAQGDRQWHKGTVDPRDQRMHLIDENNTLAEVLAEKDHVIPGHPVVYVVSRDTEFRARFLAGDWAI